MTTKLDEIEKQARAHLFHGEPNEIFPGDIVWMRPAAVLALVEALRAAQAMRSWYDKQMGPDGPEVAFDAALAKLEQAK